MNCESHKKIFFLVKSGRRARMNELEKYPTEFFYGFHELSALGLNVALIEDSDIGMGPPHTFFSRFFAMLSVLCGGLPVGMSIGLFMGKHLKYLNQASCLVATTNGMGMALALAKSFGRLHTPVVLLAMGLFPQFPGKWRKWLYRIVSHHIQIVCISKGEAKFLQSILPGQMISYLPFGVDQYFWSPGDLSRKISADYVLAIGNDLARDWETLVQAWQPSFPKLRIITSLSVPWHPENVEVIRGDWRTQVISDNEIRELYRRALLVVVPLHDTIQPAGQSVCLQAMGCGCPVVLTDIAGLWDRDLIRDGENVLLVPPGNSRALEATLQRLIADPVLREKIGRAGRLSVLEHFNTNRMALSLHSILDAVS